MAKVSKFGCLVASIAIKDQEPPLALTFFRIFIEVLDLFEA
jgi:hypothetical protein